MWLLLWLLLWLRLLLLLRLLLWLLSALVFLFVNYNVFLCFFIFAIIQMFNISCCCIFSAFDPPTPGFYKYKYDLDLDQNVLDLFFPPGMFNGKLASLCATLPSRSIQWWVSFSICATLPSRSVQCWVSYSICATLSSRRPTI